MNELENRNSLKELAEEIYSGKPNEKIKLIAEMVNRVEHKKVVPIPDLSKAIPVVKKKKNIIKTFIGKIKTFIQNLFKVIGEDFKKFLKRNNLTLDQLLEINKKADKINNSCDLDKIRKNIADLKKPAVKKFNSGRERIENNAKKFNTILEKAEIVSKTPEFKAKAKDMYLTNLEKEFQEKMEKSNKINLVDLKKEVKNFKETISDNFFTEKLKTE